MKWTPYKNGIWQTNIERDLVFDVLLANGKLQHMARYPNSLTLSTYRDKVLDAISKINGKVILVGHSFGGMIISAVAGQNPSKIEKLVYPAAYLSSSGQPLLSLAGTDAGSALGDSVNNVPILTQNANGTIDVLHNQIVNAFIQDGSAQIQILFYKIAVLNQQFHLRIQ